MNPHIVFQCGYCGYTGPVNMIGKLVSMWCPHCDRSARARFLSFDENRSVRHEMSQHDQGHTDIWRWRFQRFQDLGFSLSVADDLANTRIDLESAQRLVSAGCPLSLVQRILRGTSPFGEDLDDYLDQFDNVAISSGSEHVAQAATE